VNINPRKSTVFAPAPDQSLLQSMQELHRGIAKNPSGRKAKAGITAPHVTGAFRLSFKRSKSMADIITSPLSQPKPLGVLKPLSTVKTAISHWNQRRQTRAALSLLSDRQLGDIGLIRGDIDNL